MKLLIDTTTRRVLFAGAGKDAVDFLFSLLALPVATAVALVGKASAAGSVGNLFTSVEALDDAYVVPGADKRALLCPAVFVSPASTPSSSLLLPPPPAPWSSGGGEQPKVFFQCASVNSNNYSHATGGHGRGGMCPRYVTDAYGAACPACGGSMTQALPLEYVSPAGSVGLSFGHQRNVYSSGFVQGVVTYTVRDDLTVTSMSAISSVTLLNTFAVTDLAALTEMTVRLGYAEGVEILRASLQSKTVLTDVFLGKQGTGWSA